MQNYRCTSSETFKYCIQFLIGFARRLSSCVNICTYVVEANFKVGCGSKLAFCDLLLPKNNIRLKLSVDFVAVEALILQLVMRFSTRRFCNVIPMERLRLFVATSSICLSLKCWTVSFAVLSRVLNFPTGHNVIEVKCLIVKSFWIHYRKLESFFRGQKFATSYKIQIITKKLHIIIFGIHKFVHMHIHTYIYCTIFFK